MSSDDISKLRDLFVQLQAIRDEAYRQYSIAVEDVISDRITDIDSITAILDGVEDFCDDERFIDLYRKICKHIYYQYPEIVGEHVSLFRALWMTNEDSD